jgi:hypothetical protein
VAHQAQDTFVAQMPDGSDHFVTKGDVLGDNHPLVKRDRDAGGVLFRPLDVGDDDEKPPAKSAPAKAPAAKAVAAAKADVKAAGKVT